MVNLQQISHYSFELDLEPEDVMDNIVASFIIGAPDESVEEMWTTVRKATGLDIDFATFNPLLVFQGTPLWDELVNQGRIDPETRWEDTMVPGFEIHPEVTLKELPKLVQEMTKLFYLRKSFIARQIVRSLRYRKKKLALNLLRPKRFMAVWKSINDALS